MTEKNSTVPWYRRGPHPDSLPSRHIPTPHHLIGAPDVPLRVFLRRSAWDDIEEFAAAGDGEERGGILVGRPYTDDDGPFIVIEGAIPAHNARPTVGGVTFTQQAWDDLETTMRARFSSELVVGWFHTHPGYGVFLSGYDRFTAHRFFPEWWQLTYVIDPLRQRQGLFHWRDGGLQPLSGFWVYDDGVTVDIGSVSGAATESAAVHFPAAQGTSATGTTAESTMVTGMSVLRWASVMAVVCLLLVAATVLPLPGSLSSLNDHVRERGSETERLSDELARLRQRHHVLQQAITLMDGDDAPRPTPTTVGSGAMRGTTEADQNAEENAGAPAAPRQFSDGYDGQRYVVRVGDTLWTISERLLGDPHAYIRVASQNDLTDPDLILPGWELEMPPLQGDAAAGID